ncbi:MAG: hypothetical protein HY747_01345 [Elusimicrobia bacterium]|nr:hypothetical protein [Elusimicrobiota bacterium]
MNYQQLNLSIPETTYRELKRWVGPGKVTDFVLTYAEIGLHQFRVKKALEDSYGAWSQENHPELSRGTQAYLRCERRDRKIHQ